MEPIRSPETSVSNHVTPRNNPEYGIMQFNNGGSLQSRKTMFFETLEQKLLPHCFSIQKVTNTK